MRGNIIRSLLLPLLVAGSVAACESNGVQPGIVTTSSTASNNAYGNAVPGDPGRVVAINEVNLAGSGGGGSGRGPLLGGILGAGGGAAIGAATSHSVVGGLVGGILGAVGGAIAGTIMDNHGAMGGGRGIEVTVQKDNGQTVRVAQRDDGDIQLGDRVQIVQGRNGVAKVMRDNNPTYDPNQGQGGPPPQNYRQSSNYPPPQNYGPPPGHGPVSRTYSPNYGQSGYYSPPPQNYGQSQYNPQPQDDPRYGNLN
jgi:outer membrane lipoprotein SlyB